jgi:uncharacterized protein YjbI with pentapeptide repeats
MDTQLAIQLERIKQRVEANGADISGSTFTDVNLAQSTFTDVNLAGATIHNANLAGLRIGDANLTGVSIVDCRTDGMTINGILVAEMVAAYKTAHLKAN